MDNCEFLVDLGVWIGQKEGEGLKKRVVLRPKKEKDNTLSIRIDKDLLQTYEELSAITGYSRNALINNAMLFYVEAVAIETSDEEIKAKVEAFQNKYNKQDTE
jgi:predicted transcriptional regulator